MLFFHGPIRHCIGVSKGLKRGIQDKLQQFTQEPAIVMLKYTAVQHNEGWDLAVQIFTSTEEKIKKIINIFASQFWSAGKKFSETVHIMEMLHCRNVHYITLYKL